MATDPSSTYDPLEPIDFWTLHKGKIILYSSLAIIGAIAFTLYTFQKESRLIKAKSDFAAATTPLQLDEVIREYMGTVVAGDAALQLADLQRQEGKFDDAIATLREFIAKNPEHPLLSGGWLSLGNTLELAGRNDEALDVYQQTNSKFPDSYAAPISLLFEARLRQRLGQTDAAKALYESLIARYQRSLYAREAMRELRFINQQ